MFKQCWPIAGQHGHNIGSVCRGGWDMLHKWWNGIMDGIQITHSINWIWHATPRGSAADTTGYRDINRLSFKVTFTQMHHMTYLNPFCAGTVFRRQILTYKYGPRAEIIKLLMAVDPQHIKIKRKELTKPFMKISNWKKTHFGRYSSYKNIAVRVNPYPAKLIHLNFQPLEVVSRYRDTQFQVAENYSYLFNLSTNICQSWCLNTHFISNISDLVD